MIRIGITGQAGFIGTHLYNALGLSQDRFERVPFEDGYYLSENLMDGFVRQCDVIVHLAAVNRHADREVLYQTNVDLVSKLIAAMERCRVTPYVVMSSSLQEERDNLYGRSKREGRALFDQWTERTGASFSGLIIPNVFGPFGVPYYNSVVSTFSHQLMIGEEPRIEIDAELKLIYVGDLVQRIIGLFPADTADRCADDADENSHTDGSDGTEGHGPDKSEFSILNSQFERSDTQFTILNSNSAKPPRLIHIDHQAMYKVTELLAKLRGFHRVYVENGVFPDLRDYFDICLFNTFRSYLPTAYFPRPLKVNADYRGIYVEVMKYMSGGQTSFSTTKPGITRGNHFHTRKVERFAVIKGKASIKLRKTGTDQVFEFVIDGSQPAYVDMPVWFTHNITNIGDDELVTLFWINEFFDPTDPDTYFEEV
ncbi:MAG: NAD-dependent epimerase/dehydratase family protein [Candidatus Cloacimonetes bacterium]|nr:NAD-dependent epimerase/dehydratase family protein [Candidatus Cloacimonadota bacterium]